MQALQVSRTIHFSINNFSIYDFPCNFQSIRMESTGKPGHIHITQETFNFLENKYVSEPGEEFEGKTSQNRLGRIELT